MVEGGVELPVGVGSDPVFGPVVACGAGGTAVELLGDVAVRVCPLGASDGEEMARSLAIFPMLTGFRAQPPVDLEALAELILRVGALADDVNEAIEQVLDGSAPAARTVFDLRSGDTEAAEVTREAVRAG